MKVFKFGGASIKDASSTLFEDTSVNITFVDSAIETFQDACNVTFIKVTVEKEDKVANMIFASIYQLYLDRLEKNGKTKEELNQILEWFTGFDKDEIQILIEEKVTFRTFFERAKINFNAHLIKGVVCGYRIEDIEEKFDLYKQCRRMEKLIDELAKGRKMEKILRK